jgi:hypothetical protein
MSSPCVGAFSRRRIIVRTAIFLCFALTMTARAQTPSGPIPASLFSMTYMDGRNYPATPFLSTGSLGKGIAVVWHYVQPSSLCPSSPCNSFNWGSLDNYVNLANSHGVDFFYDFDNVPRWAVANTGTCGANGNSSDACTGMVANMSDWTNYVTAVVQRYDGKHGHGRILIYEMWNEPNNAQDWTGTQAQLAALARQAVSIVRANDAAQAVNPPTILTTPSGSASFLGGFMSAYLAVGGRSDDFDAVSLHAYLGTNTSNCSGLNVPCAEAISLLAANFRSQMANFGLAGKALFNTEGSWGTDSLTSAQQVAFVARWELMHWSSGIARMMWYAVDNSSWGQLCTGGPPCTLTPAGNAYNRAFSWMVGSTMTSPCTSAGTVYTCGMTLANGSQALAVWNTTGSSTFTPPVEYTKYEDLAGTTKDISGLVTIGIQPILLLGVSGATASPPSPPTNLTAIAH